GVVAVHATFLHLAVRTLGKANGVLAGLLFLSHPVAYILNTWLGLVDPVTVGSTVVVLFSKRFVPVLAASTLSMFNHSATIFIVAWVFLLRSVATPKEVTFPTLAAGGIGVAIGKLLCIATYRLYPFRVYTRWDFVLDVPLRHLLEINFAHFSLCLYSFAL